MNIKGNLNLLKILSSVSSKKLRTKPSSFSAGASMQRFNFGADKVACCPLSNDFNYLFQANYQKHGRHRLTFKEGASTARILAFSLNTRGRIPGELLSRHCRQDNPLHDLTISTSPILESPLTLAMRSWQAKPCGVCLPVPIERHSFLYPH